MRVNADVPALGLTSADLAGTRSMADHALKVAFSVFDVDGAMPRHKIIALLTRTDGAAALTLQDAELIVERFIDSDGHFNVAQFSKACSSISGSAVEISDAAELFNKRLAEVTFQPHKVQDALKLYNSFMDDFASAARRAGMDEAAFRESLAASGQPLLEPLLVEAAVRFWKSSANKMDTPIASAYYVRLASASFRGAGIDVGRGVASNFRAAFEDKMSA